MQFVFLPGLNRYLALSAIAYVDTDCQPPSYVGKSCTVKLVLRVPESVSESLEGLRGETHYLHPQDAEPLIEALSELSK